MRFTYCPHCGSTLTNNDDEVALRCGNYDCNEQIVQRLIYFCSLNAMNIDGLGDAIVRKLVDLGVKTYLDIFNLSRETLYQIENFGEKSVNNILINVEKSKKNPLWRVINALGINLIGEKSSKDIARDVKSLEKFLLVTRDDLMNIDGIGQKSADSVVDFLSNSENIAMLRGFIAMDIGAFERTDMDVDNDGIFSGKTFVLTGKLRNFSRSQAKEIIERNGGIVASSISKKVDIVLAGDDSGQKLTAAEKYNITIWNEDEFLERIK